MVALCTTTAAPTPSVEPKCAGAGQVLHPVIGLRGHRHRSGSRQNIVRLAEFGAGIERDRVDADGARDTIFLGAAAAALWTMKSLVESPRCGAIVAVTLTPLAALMVAWSPIVAALVA